jgi:hypothetical protein
MGKFQEIQTVNRQVTKDMIPGYTFYTLVRKSYLFVNFSWQTTSTFELKIPSDIIQNGI